MQKSLFRVIVVAAVAFGSIACYHATVDTGRPPSGVRISRPFAASFLGGLIPPGDIETMQRCPDGVARVETSLSFLNILVGSLTWGLYSPMTIRVECAAPETRQRAEAVLEVPATAGFAETVQVFDQAARMVQDEGGSVLVRLPSEQ